MSDPASFVDVLDPDYSSFASTMERRQHFFVSMLRLRALANELSRQAHEEYERRQQLEPAVHRTNRLQRERDLREAVLRAIESRDDMEARILWSEVDGLLG